MVGWVPSELHDKLKKFVSLRRDGSIVHRITDEVLADEIKDKDS